MIRSNFVAVIVVVDCAPCGECWVTLKLRQKEPQSGENRQRGATRATTTCNARQQALERPLARRRLPLFLPLYDFFVVVFLFACHLQLLLLLLFPFAIPNCCFFFTLFLPIADFQPASRLVPGDAYVKCTMEACLPHPAPC